MQTAETYRFRAFMARYYAHQLELEQQDDLYTTPVQAPPATRPLACRPPGGSPALEVGEDEEVEGLPSVHHRAPPRRSLFEAA